jgi:hypothetical protein
VGGILVLFHSGEEFPEFKYPSRKDANTDDTGPGEFGHFVSDMVKWAAILVSYTTLL